ncbi:MAG: hypothetical protein JRE81_02810, partial [Deltaproteobacteria bacterium]|nr:hypothetical protein [Deltaproteobacteria bacterium]
EGGVVTATGADGTEYSLSIPVDALIEDTEISLTPIVGIDDLPMSGGFVAGVHFEPSGLELFRTATLRVTQPSAPSLEDDEALAGFVYDGDGENLGLALAEVTANSFTVPVNHFSGGGGGAANPGELAAASVPGSASDFIAQLMSAVETQDSGAAESILRQWYETRVRPGLQAAVSSDDALDRALEEYQRWLNAAGALPGAFSQPADVDVLVSESHTLAAGAFIEAIARANDLCERNASFDEAEKALRWLLRAESVLPESVLLQNGLDRSTVLVELCLQVVFESTSFPESPVVGAPATLSLVVGYSFGGGPTVFAEDMLIGVLATGATPGTENIITDELGEATLELTPTSPGVDVEAEACISNAPGAGALTGVLVCQTAFIVRGLVIDPNPAQVNPGGMVSFAALLGGSATDVTWSATGGTIDSSGLYTAGDQEGDFQVTATSVEDPELAATAIVSIGAAGECFEGAYVGTYTETDQTDGSIFRNFENVQVVIATCNQRFSFSFQLPTGEQYDNVNGTLMGSPEQFFGSLRFSQFGNALESENMTEVRGSATVGAMTFTGLLRRGRTAAFTGPCQTGFACGLREE